MNASEAKQFTLQEFFIRPVNNQSFGVFQRLIA